jgi:hypothetical protein
MGPHARGGFALIACFSLLSGIATLTLPAVSHDWYPMECCSGTDCAEVDHATYDRTPDITNKLPILAVTTVHGTALVPENFPRRESLDGKMHACMRPASGDMSLICLFVPPPS